MHRVSRLVTLLAVLSLGSFALAQEEGEVPPKKQVEKAVEESRAAQVARNAAYQEMLKAVAALKERLAALGYPVPENPDPREDTDGHPLWYGPKGTDGKRSYLLVPAAAVKADSPGRDQPSLVDLFHAARKAQSAFEKADEEDNKAIRKLRDLRTRYGDEAFSSVDDGHQEDETPAAEDGSGEQPEESNEGGDAGAETPSTADFLARLQFAAVSLDAEIAVGSLGTPDAAPTAKQATCAETLRALIDAVRQLDSIGARLAQLATELATANDERKAEIRREASDLGFQVEAIVNRANELLRSEAFTSSGLIELSGLTPYVGGTTTWFTTQGASLIQQSLEIEAAARR